MTNVKINEISLTGSLTSGDSFIVLDTETQDTKRATINTITNYVNENTFRYPVVSDIAERNNLSVEDGDVVRVKSTGELFVWDNARTKWVLLPNSSTRPDFFYYDDVSYSFPVLYVSTTGSDDNGEGTQASPFRSVTRALQMIPRGYRTIVFVTVESGSYNDCRWHFPESADIQQGDVASGNTFYATPQIRVFSPSPYINGEEIYLSSSNLTASLVPHPSNNGNYAALSDFNVPTFTTPISSSDIKGDYILYGPPSSFFGFQTPGFSNRVVYSGSYDSGSLRVVNPRNNNLFEVGNYYLTNVDKLPQFTNLTTIINSCKNASTSVYNVCFKKTPTLKGINIYACSFQESGAWILSSDQINNALWNCSIKSSPAYTSGGYMWWQGAFRGGMSGCYIYNTKVNVSIGQYFSLAGVYESSLNIPKLITGTDDTSTSHGAGPSVGISYLGGMDFIGPGVGMQFSNTSVRASAGSGNFSFSGVSNPLVLCNNSFWGHLNPSAIGDCTAPVIVGTKSMTGNAFTTTQAGPGIAGWNITNTANPGQEVIVGAVTSSFAFSDLPQTDLILGTGSIGAIAR